MPGWLETLLVGLLGRVVLPIANTLGGIIRKRVPKWLAALRRFVRRRQLMLTLDDDHIAILASIHGRQMDYAHVQNVLAGRLEGEDLLRAVTFLEAAGLLNRPRLSQPPDPRALLTVSADAGLVLPSGKRPRRVKPRRRDISEAVVRRARLHDDRHWLQDYDEQARQHAYLSSERMEEQSVRRSRLQEDEAWLASHGFKRS
ncbi:MAG: hypothetical protein QMC79_08460 [Anaerosomatales bacterium]|nr:hypothetical protein [Anaerosomatales bacterium]